MRNRLLLVAAAVAALVVLFIVLRPGKDEKHEAPPRPATAANLGSTTSAKQVRISEIVVSNGTVPGGPLDADVKRGARHRLIVYADVNDLVHVHGYDLTARVRPRKPARIEFVADVAGRFEVELEESGLRVGEITVHP